MQLASRLNRRDVQQTAKCCFKVLQPTSSINIATKDNSINGEFVRSPTSFHNVIAKDSEFPPEKDRYHLYVSYACPWATRALITRQLKGLTDVISLSVVHWHMDENGWRFAEPDEDPDCIPDTVNGFKRLRELYLQQNPDYSGRVTVPVLYDKKTKKIVNNESSEVIRILYTAFDDLIEPKYKSLNFYPENLQAQIDEHNDWIYNDINNGVYKSGFATTQEAYEKAVTTLFKSMDRVESILAESDGPYFLGKDLTEIDIRLFPTLIRFDCCYVQHFKCNIGTIRHNYPHINKYMKNLYWNVPGFKEVTNFRHIKFHYTKSHKQINPLGITPVGPIPDIEPL
ncbi:hypothetical protein CANCADRAFT_147691 [Tortispora caseinolytica NRRL Y-17796]|uniref:GST C-terminal domain-containing protein n=1 Tax=Tortispora caseinolytica NRRL Y-17796 TaxID=767744 RepID=A0A1E4TM64_9ASCO|nr:hypothetical protein CANCADRAFT_147691 [Tortispora caseinolytica NRRL Y-17796]